MECSPRRRTGVAVPAKTSSPGREASGSAVSSAEPHCSAEENDCNFLTRFRTTLMSSVNSADSKSKVVFHDRECRIGSFID